MNNPLQEDLLGYVLGALDAQEQRDLEQRIDQDPELEEQLLQIRTSLLPLDYIESAGSCPGLARRTCESVAIWQNGDPVGKSDGSCGFVADGSAGFPMAPSAETHSESELAVAVSGNEASGRPGAFGTDRMLHPSTWSMPDVLVGIALLAIVAGILFPAISFTRSQSRLAACQDNLQQLAVSFLTYSSINDGRFVEIPSDGPLSVSGCFAPTLKDAGLLQDDSLLACAGLGAKRPPVVVPSRKQILDANNDELLSYYHQTMAGDYGYALGYRSNGKYYAPRNRGRSHVLLVSDQPSIDLPGRQSRNHNGQGQNCMFEDGHVAFVAGHSRGGDALFMNDYGLVAPGVGVRDNVIAPSHLSPMQVLDNSPDGSRVLETF